MKTIRGIAIILGFLALGEFVSVMIRHFIPGSVAGMLLLFAALCLRIVKIESVREVADFLTGNMTIFFIPAFVGIMNEWGIIRTNFWGWVIVLISTTVIVMVCSGLAAEWTIKLKTRRRR
ncbi:MAG: CidA/LrgA family protein [Bacteroidales bacterium]|nr:CidA/LrgA family protein [Candidatus Cryptobacteroides onthequi]